MIKFQIQEWKTEKDKVIFNSRNMQLIKFITAGNVDDGKSTLIGRLLFDSNAISNDVLENIKEHNGEINLAYLTDGLKAEREQGITIDVAYKYFSTKKRKFIIADCPGHKEYTKNMITGASHADIAIVLIDAKTGITEQTKRHTFIIDLMNIPCIIFCINKMDAVNYDEKVFNHITEKINQIKFIHQHQIEYIPVSALKGDNIVHRSKMMNWYNGSTLIHLLETYEPPKIPSDLPALIQIQYVSVQDNERYFYGNVMNAEINTGDEIIIHPTKQKNIIKQIYVDGQPQTSANHQPVCITLAEPTEIQRGYFLMKNNSSIHQHSYIEKQSTQSFSAICFWMDQQPFVPNKRYFIQHHSYRSYIKCQNISEIFNFNNLEFENYNHTEITMNSIFKANFISANSLLLSDYRTSRTLGSFIMIDETSYRTAGAGIVIYSKYDKPDKP